jgi:nitrous oxidase accessory protein NosD
MLALALPGCDGASRAPVSVVPPQAQAARKIVVTPGQSIQAAVDRAEPGDTIFVEPGTYREAGRACPFDASETCAVSVTKDQISLVGQTGKKPVVLANSRGLSNGIAVGNSLDCSSGRIDGSRIAGFTVKDFGVAGIAIDCVENWDLGYDTALHDGLYGLFVSYSDEGRLHDSAARGVTRAGIHVGLSADVRVDHNVARDNVMGFEVREDVRVTVDANAASENTAGIFELIMPGDPLERSRENLLLDNVVQNNDRPNKCATPSDPVCKIAPGVGIAIAGGSHNVTLGNHVTGNATFGIAVIDVCTAFELSASQCEQLGFNPLARYTRTERNVALYNGTDLLWSANGRGNCWRRNRAKLRVPESLPKCG